MAAHPHPAHRRDGPQRRRAGPASHRTRAALGQATGRPCATGTADRRALGHGKGCQGADQAATARAQPAHPTLRTWAIARTATLILTRIASVRASRAAKDVAFLRAGSRRARREFVFAKRASDGALGDIGGLPRDVRASPHGDLRAYFLLGAKQQRDRWQLAPAIPTHTLWLDDGLLATEWIGRRPIAIRWQDGLLMRRPTGRGHQADL